MEVGIDPERARKDGLTKEDLARAAMAITDASQFTSRPEEMPEFASDNWGRILWQFKNFSYQQTRFIYRQLVQGDWDDRMLGMFVFFVLYPAFGELAIALRRELTGYRPKRPEGAWRYFEDLTRMGSLGMMVDAAQKSSRFYGFTAWLMGPTGSTIEAGAQALGKTANPAIPLEAKRKAWLKFITQHLPYGSMARRFLEEPKPGR
jgi:hypothetical protein